MNIRNTDHTVANTILYSVLVIDSRLFLWFSFANVYMRGKNLA